MKVVLAEKPSVARELASFLGASAPPGRLLRGEGLPGDLGPRAPGDPEGAARLRPGLEEMVAGGAADRARAVRDQADRGRRCAEAARGGPPAIPRRRRADLRDRRRPRGRADLPVHPGARRLHGQAGPPALAQLAHRGGHPRRLPRACGRSPITTTSMPRRGAAARPTGSSASTRPAITPSAIAPAASSGASAACRPPSWR